MLKTDIDPATIIDKLGQSVIQAAEDFVPWFLDQMPETYFQNTSEEMRMEHMRAILALRASGQEPMMRIRSADRRRITYLLPRDYPGMLVNLMKDFGDELIRSAKLYSSKNRELVIDIFEVGPSEHVSLDDPNVKMKYDETLRLAREIGAEWTEQSLREHFGRLGHQYVLDCPPRRILGHAELYNEVRRTAGSAVRIDNTLYPNLSRVVLAVANAPAKRMLVRVAKRFATLDINVIRAYIDAIQAGEEESVVIISAVVEAPGGGQIDPESPLWHRLHRDLHRLKWLDPETMALAWGNHNIGLGSADILHTYCDLTTQLLVKTNRYLYSRARIREIVEQYMSISRELVDLFRARFDPDESLDDADYGLRERKIRDRIDSELEDEMAHTVFSTMLMAISATLKSNFYVVGRYAHSLRLAPELLMTVAPRPETPYGVFFVHGRDFNAFHVRFRDTARGGVRVVRPASKEQHIRETERHFDECYDLAYAQQLKNKDIPEGGAKAVILVEPNQTITRCVRAFADAMLDLITSDPVTRNRIRDRYGKPEFLYFGPDENITPDHIVWIVERAEQRGYPYPNALMSSKPGAGINHKEYGVTSEGVNVFLEVALNAIGINPRKQSFTIKLTGGPDGDVAGNEMKILMREYSKHVKIVGIADGFGCAEDPEGLNHDELKRLVTNSRPIADFDPSKLSDRGKLTRVTDPDGVRIRNEMHNRVISDAFVPAGGRPETINLSNWQRFLTTEGEPSSRLIVEGANLFITPDARRKLFEAGVLVIKDSSANKCGVICSSYEIMASLMISEEEFLEIKPQYVEQVLERLRAAAGLEAELLFEERRRRPNTSLVDLGIMLSREINRLTDAIERDYEKFESGVPELVREMVIEHIPPVLVEIAGDRVWSRLPDEYRKQIVCAALASRVIYREGLDYFRDTPDNSLAELVLAYLLRDERNHHLVRVVEDSPLAEKQEIADLLRIGGTRAGLQGRWHKRAQL
ncbi:MAG: NAD-glutamate dehydrogenase domain-containing protein [Phycisphaerales bacterium]